MTNYVIDAYAWIEYFEGSEEGEKVKEIIEDRKNEIFTCSVTVSEIISKFIRSGKDKDIAVKAIRAFSKIISADDEICIRTGQLHAEIKRKIKDFGLADAFVLATSNKFGAKILTGDSHFKDFKEAILINEDN